MANKILFKDIVNPLDINIFHDSFSLFMIRAYSVDLRQKVIDFLANGHSKVETCKVLNISKSTLFSWIRLFNQTNNLNPKPIIRSQRKIDLSQLSLEIEKHPDKNLKEYAALFAVSAPGILKSLRKLGITLKKH